MSVRSCPNINSFGFDFYIETSVFLAAYEPKGHPCVWQAPVQMDRQIDGDILSICLELMHGFARADLCDNRLPSFFYL